MLSEAKHLQCFLEYKQMPILRFAQDDSLEDFFRGLREERAGLTPRSTKE